MNYLPLVRHVKCTTARCEYLFIIMQRHDTYNQGFLNFYGYKSKEFCSMAMWACLRLLCNFLRWVLAWTIFFIRKQQQRRSCLCKLQDWAFTSASQHKKEINWLATNPLSHYKITSTMTFSTWFYDRNISCRSLQLFSTSPRHRHHQNNNNIFLVKCWEWYHWIFSCRTKTVHAKVLTTRVVKWSPLWWKL